jgi:ketosteroid isomerase-like protein
MTDKQNPYEIIVARLQAALQQWYKGDPSAYVSLFAEDLTYFAPVTNGRLEGGKALKGLLAPLAGKINVPRFEVLNPKLQLHGDIGVLTYNISEYAGDGSVAVRWNSTEVHRRSGAEWRIIHAHWSRIPDST